MKQAAAKQAAVKQVAVKQAGKRAGDCTTMAELRAGIDLLDADLVQLLAERAAYIDRAAEVKAQANLPARIDSRVEEVVQNVRRHALTRGLPPDLVETLWRHLIDWSIAREDAALTQTGAQKGAQKGAPNPEQPQTGAQER